MNTHSRSRRALGIAVALALAVTVSACGGRDAGRSGDAAEGAPSPGITDTTVTLGITTPLSGPTAGPGTCTVAGVTAYFGAKNAAGGVEFGDGKTRTVEIQALDDTYDPQQAAANYDQLKGEVFAMTAGLGTPTNRAWREAAIADEVPQVLIMTGDPLFSDTQQSPWQLGFVPIYQNEGAAFGELLASSGAAHRVAILSQNDDFGAGYVQGFKSAIEGAGNIEVVGELTYEATDTSVDAQITELANSGADVFFNAMSVTPLVIAALQKAQQLGWTPSWFLPSNTSSPTAILEPGGAAAFPGIYSVSFAKAPQSPAFAQDPDVVEYLAALKQYGNYPDLPAFPHCQWSWMIGATLEQAFQNMKEPTRDSFMEALRAIKDFQAPLMLPDTAVTTSESGQPAVSTVVVQKYNGRGYDTVEAFG
ncbi:amino acid/amide ABC transporter substrate-binding protein (HAAT family) [Pseudonocardia hierapolitana]|uniref:Amino acid/amide ABC transporter substrate-binding protein (HAAT family) n=1 Tax=Pseudonocardia hierapolitana TaxID=1128676 RepID=A0A561SJA6_9PSEU|nr:ABC transporter substrate-binding protein [Pseudonocardia hierapolitana]TWF74902.1 amino acid/amide ABC transporter substrate-binding protein (HAAT family) [Pseudonocardia hierapolitana]